MSGKTDILPAIYVDLCEVSSENGAQEQTTLNWKVNAFSAGSGCHSALFPSENFFGDNHRTIIICTYYKIQKIVQWKGNGISI